jgi:cell division protein FtsQ
VERARRGWRLVRARPDAVPASLRRAYRRPTPHGARPWVVGAVVLVGLAALAWVVLATPVLGVRVVEVNGTTIAGPDQVRSVAAVPRGTPLARVDTGAVADRVGALPSVAQVVVRRWWPDTLVITVRERSPVAVVAAGSDFLVVDGSGVVFDRRHRRPDGAVLIRVARPGPDDPATRAALRVVAALTPALRERVRAVEATSATAITVRLRGNRAVVWGDAERSDTKAAVATVLVDRPGRTIDVSAPDVATVR